MTINKFEYIKKMHEHDQLEELKELRTTSCGYSKEDIELNRNAMYNKAIDDFIHKCDKYCGLYSGGNKILTREDVLKIAEQLKAGVENEQSI